MPAARPLSSWRGWALVLSFVILPLAAIAGLVLERRAEEAAARARIPELEAQILALGVPRTLDEIAWPDVPPERDAGEFWRELSSLRPRWEAAESAGASESAVLAASFPVDDPARAVLQELVRVLEEAQAAGEATPELPRHLRDAAPLSPVLLARMRVELARGAPLRAHAEALAGLAGVRGEPLARARLADAQGLVATRRPVDLGQDRLTELVRGVDELCRLLAIEARVAAAGGDAAQAMESVERALDLARALRGDPTTLAAVMRCRAIGDALLSLLAVLPRLRDAAGLEDLEQRIAALRPWEDLAWSWEVEAVQARQIARAALEGAIAPARRLPFLGERTALNIVGMLEEELASAQWRARTPAEAGASLCAASRALPRQPSYQVSGMANSAAEAEVLRQLALVALARARGGRAAAEAALASSLDPYAGSIASTAGAASVAEPLRARHEPEVLVVWSIGSDGTDDGGTCEERSLETPDLVLRLR